MLHAELEAERQALAQVQVVDLEPAIGAVVGDRVLLGVRIAGPCVPFFQ